MRKLTSYAALQMKRAVKLMPQMLAVTLLLSVLAALAATIVVHTDREDASKTPIRIALVGDSDNAFLSDALSLLKNADSSRFSFRLDQLDEAEAIQLLRLGQLTGVIQLADGFSEAFYYGEHLPITYYSHSSGSDVGSQMTRELVLTVSDLVLATERAIYSAQDLIAAKLPGVDPMTAGDTLVIRYAAAILDRDRLFQVEQLGAADSLTLAGYYLCGIVLLFIMLWSISCAPLFSRRSRELGQLLNAQGLGSAGQILGEFAGYLLLLFCALLLAGGLGGALLGRFGIRVAELQGRSNLPLFLISRFVPPALMLCSLQFLLYELSDGTVSGILLQFLNAVVQGYLAGCFYPSSFFPEGLRRVGSFLPAGFAMRFLRAGLLDQRDLTAAIGVWFFFLLFFGLSLLVRSRRNRA